MKKATTDTWPEPTKTVTYGTATDTWGTTWTPADVNAPSFGAAVAARGAMAASETASVDRISVTVYFERCKPLPPR